MPLAPCSHPSVIVLPQVKFVRFFEHEKNITLLIVSGGKGAAGVATRRRGTEVLRKLKGYTGINKCQR